MKQLTNSGQTVTDTYDTDAWGANGSSSGSTVNPFRFGGQFAYFTDADSGLLRLGVRYLDPANGRFTQKDPVGELILPYVYASSQPTALSDPSGLWSPPAHCAVLLKEILAALRAAANATSPSEQAAACKRANDVIWQWDHECADVGWVACALYRARNTVCKMAGGGWGNRGMMRCSEVPPVAVEAPYAELVVEAVESGAPVPPPSTARPPTPTRLPEKRLPPSGAAFRHSRGSGEWAQPIPLAINRRRWYRDRLQTSPISLGFSTCVGRKRGSGRGDGQRAEAHRSNTCGKRKHSVNHRGVAAGSPCARCARGGRGRGLAAGSLPRPSATHRGRRSGGRRHVGGDQQRPVGAPRPARSALGTLGSTGRGNDASCDGWRVGCRRGRFGVRGPAVEPAAKRRTTTLTSLAYDHERGENPSKTTLSNRTYATYSYDSNRYWLTSLANKKSDATTLSSFAYEYDYGGNPSKMTLANGDYVNYGYDNVYELTSEVKKNSSNETLFSGSYTYDAGGNRTQSVINGNTTNYTYDDANKMTAAGSTSFGYDNNGNMTSKTENSQTTSYSYNYENHMTGITYPDQSTNSFGYYGIGQRAWKVDSAGTSRFVYDGDEYGAPILAEVGGGGDYIATYTHGVQGLVSQRRGSTTNWYAYDDLGSTRNLTNSAQTITDAYTYKAFGEIPAASGSTTNPFRYIGALNYYQDADSGLLMLGARYYGPGWGRFSTRDPRHDGPNWYAYAGNGPLAIADPPGTGGTQPTCFKGYLFVHGFFKWFDQRGSEVKRTAWGFTRWINTCDDMGCAQDEPLHEVYYGPAQRAHKIMQHIEGPIGFRWDLRIWVVKPYHGKSHYPVEDFPYLWEPWGWPPGGPFTFIITAKWRFVGELYRCRSMRQHLEPPWIESGVG